MYYLSMLILWAGLAYSGTTDPVLSEVEQQKCEVLVEAISKSYEGDCKRGKAHGEGVAKGVDTYEGEFKKGLPDGEGTYTWANGDVYEGEFEKGMKEGAGTLTKSDGTPPLVGYWIEDEYIGTEKDPYSIINKSVSINRVMFRRLDKEPNQIVFQYTRLGKPVKAQGLNILGSFGVIMAQNDFSQTVKIHEFPFQGGINFRAMSNRDVGGRGGGEYIDGNMEFKINQPGNWEVTIEMQGAD